MLGGVAPALYRASMSISDPALESERLRALHAYNILDTSPEDSFDDLVKLASNICGTPIALISLVDEARQWFKASQGMIQRETPRAISFCTHALQRPEIMLVADAQEDPRFSANPLVTGAPHVRFYAGAPLRTVGGQALGTLCVLDRVPRELSASQLEALRILSAQVMVLLEQRRVMAALAQALEQVKTLEGLLPICSYCHQIREEDGAWKRLETYISEHSAAHFSHGICHACFTARFPEEDER
jgi:GAF domain-containing protein